MNWITTSTILEGLRDPNNRAAWSSFVGTFLPAIETYGRKLGLDPHTAEDAAQRTLADFSELYRRGTYRREAGQLRTWLFTIAHRRVVDLLRRRSAARDLAETLDSPGEDTAGHDVWRDVWERAVLERCLERVRGEVNEQTYSVFIESFVHERPAKDVAHDFRMTENAVFLVRYRVLVRLRELGRELDDG